MQTHTNKAGAAGAQAGSTHNIGGLASSSFKHHESSLVDYGANTAGSGTHSIQNSDRLINKLNTKSALTSQHSHAATSSSQQ